MAVLVAVVRDERISDALNSFAGMAIGIAGGCAFPPQNLPGFLRYHVGPLLPSYWFADTVRSLEGGSHPQWVLAWFKLAGVSVLLIMAAALLFRRRFKTGGKA